MTDPVDLDRLAAAHAAATPGPWWTDGKYNGREMGCAIIAANTDAGPLPGNPTRGMVAWASAVLNTEARLCEANAHFIALAHNAMPAILAELRQLRAERDRLREALGAADAIRSGIREAGLKRQPALYPAVMAYDAARAALGGEHE